MRLRLRNEGFAYVGAGLKPAPTGTERFMASSASAALAMNVRPHAALTANGPFVIIQAFHHSQERYNNYGGRRGIGGGERP